MASPPAGCWSRLMSSPTTKTTESTILLNGVNSMPSSDSDIQALVSRIETIVNGGLSDGAKVLSISNVSFENGTVSYKVEIDRSCDNDDRSGNDDDRSCDDRSCYDDDRSGYDDYCTSYDDDRSCDDRSCDNDDRSGNDDDRSCD
ncbi:hypothetical protein THAOC_34171, partial [Thalassiosira oceanica]